MKVGSGGMEAVKKALGVFTELLAYEKNLGKTSMRKLLMKGGDLQVLQFETKDQKQVERLAKKYGILYSVLPDINTKDGMSEVIFHSEAVPRVNMLLEKLTSGRIATFDEYLKNGDEKEYRDLMERTKLAAAKSNPNLVDVTISKTLIVEENERGIKTRVPGTFGPDIRYLWLDKENTIEIHEGKTILSFLERVQTYPLYDKDNNVVIEMSGDDLYTSHYDKVEAVIRERYELGKEETKTIQVKKEKGR